MPFGLPLRTRNTIVEVYGALLFGQALGPVGRNQLADVGDRIDVVRQRQRDHVGFQAVDHRRACLPDPPWNG